MLKIRPPLGRLIVNMGIAIPGKTVFLIETAPCFLLSLMRWGRFTDTGAILRLPRVCPDAQEVIPKKLGQNLTLQQQTGNRVHISCDVLQFIRHKTDQWNRKKERVMCWYILKTRVAQTPCQRYFINKTYIRITLGTPLTAVGREAPVRSIKKRQVVCFFSIMTVPCQCLLLPYLHVRAIFALLLHRYSV